MPSESVPRRFLAAAQAVVAGGVTARLHFLYVTGGRVIGTAGTARGHQGSTASHAGITVALVLGTLLTAVCVLAAAGVISAGATRLKLGAALYAGIATLVCVSYRNDPWDAQAAAAGVYGGLSLWHLASLVELRSVNWRLRRGS